MQIYPAIDIKDGKCVRLQQGKFDQLTIFNDEPSEVAKNWQSKGASYIHIVDLDGARYGSGYNNKVIEKILEHVTIPIQVGGGIRTLRDIEDKINMGVSRVILGTVAIKNPDLIDEAIHKFGDKIAIGIDAKNGKVAVEGWEELSSIEAIDLCMDMKNKGIKTIIYTDISKDGMMQGPNVEMTKEIVDKTGLYIIASGGVSNNRDLENLQKINVGGAIVGKALYQEALRLKDIINVFEK